MSDTEGVLEDGDEIRASEPDELRAKYSQADRDKMAGNEAMSDGSYPIKDAEDLENAIRAVGRGSNSSHDAIRKHIIARAKALGLESKIPDGWNADGSLSQANSATDDLEQRAGGEGLEFRKRLADRLKGTIEHREFDVAGLECRNLDDGTIRMSGYGSVTEHAYEVGPFTEVIRRGAFKRTLSEDPDVVLLYGHEGMPLARTKVGSLALEENAKGLHWTADLDPEDPDSRVLARKVERGLIDQCSFAFQVTQQDWNDEMTERSIKAVSLHRGDVSLVAMGANEATTVGVTSLRSTDGELELRAGKAISAANKAKIEAFVADLLGEEPAEVEPAEVVPDEPKRSVVVPDYTTTARLQLARMKGTRP